MSLKACIKHFLREFRENKTLVIVALSFIVLSFSIYLVLDDDTICRLGRENGLFEGLTPVFFLAASVTMFWIFLRNKNLFCLLFSIAFFVGMGEEISWGQKILHFATPDLIKEHNVQKELNIHNLELLNSARFNGTQKTGWARIASINFLFKVFWFVYGVLLPIGFYCARTLRRILEKIKMPIAPLSLGILFIPNYLIMKMLGSGLVDHGSFQYLDTAGEIYECGTGLIFFFISLYFLKSMKGKPPEPAA